MKELKIYEFQAKAIEDTLRLVARCMKSSSRKTSVDRDIMQSWQTIKNVLSENIDEHVPRFINVEDDQKNIPAYFAVWLNELEDEEILEACYDDNDLQMAINLQNYYTKNVHSNG